MNKCTLSLAIVLVTLITATAPEDICESCVLITKCPVFASLGKAEQLSWLRKYPCNNQHPDDYGTPPGSKTTQADFICCPNQIWGVDSKESHSSKITDKNRFGDSQDTNSFSDQSQYPYYYNNDNHRDIGASNEASLFTNRQRDTDVGNQSPHTNVEASRWSSPYTGVYWNNRPDRNKWDIGNRNFYHGNDNRRLLNNRRNDYNNDGRSDNNYNQGGRRYQPDYNSNNRGFDRNDNDYKYQPYYPSNRRSGDSFGKPGQCDRLTSLPPSPQSGCCGREAPDDDRITGTPFKINSNNELETKLTKTIDDAPRYYNNAPTFNNYDNEREKPENYGWTYSMFKEEGSHTVTINNNTVTVVNGTQGVNSTVSVEKRISGGRETELTQYPWTALLIATFQNGLQQTAFNCGGSLISSRYVLTAGHCVYDSEAVLKSVQVFLAEYDKRTFPQDCKLTAEGRKCIDNLAILSEDVIRHPRFDETRLLNDIALIKLQTDAPYTEYIRPICLPSINIDNPEHARLPLTVAGWGRNGQYKSDIKQSTTVHLVPQYDCKKFYPDLTRRHLCAAGYTGEDSCKGDSGGPLMVLYRGMYYVVGVVSGKRTDTPCGSTVPSLYTNVYHYLDWIRSNIN